MLVDDFLHHREAKAGAAGFACDIRLERTAKYIRRKSRSIVFDGQPYRTRLRTRFLDFDKLGAHVNACVGSAGQCVLRIDQQVVNHLAQLGRVTFDQRQAGPQWLDPFDRAQSGRNRPLYRG